MAGLLPYIGHENLFKRINFEQSWRDPAASYEVGVLSLLAGTRIASDAVEGPPLARVISSGEHSVTR